MASVILIPPSPSLPLHSSLLSLSSRLHGANASSFPSTTLPEANSKLLDLLLDHYSNLAGGKISQNMALQFSFDLRFLQTLLVSREAKDSRSPTFSSLMEKVESHIDPFDLSVFSSHLETRMRWATARSVSGLAALVPPDRAALVASYKVISHFAMITLLVSNLQPDFPCSLLLPQALQEGRMATMCSLFPILQLPGNLTTPSLLN